VFEDMFEMSEYNFSVLRFSVVVCHWCIVPCLILIRNTISHLHPKGPDEVIKFCTDCVLSEEEEPCDVPSTIFRDENVGDGSLSP
jgi:hypothetical protein